MPRPRQSLLLGVCGSSAATTTSRLVGLLQRFIAEAVTPVCTPAAVKFTDLAPGAFVDDAAWDRAPLHIDLTRSAQEFVVCPATANMMAKAALGLADNLLTTCVLAYSGPIWWVPCTNRALWGAVTTQAHVAVLRERGHHVLEPHPVTGLAQAGQSSAFGLEWPEVINTLLRTYLERL